MVLNVRGKTKMGRGRQRKGVGGGGGGGVGGETKVKGEKGEVCFTLHFKACLPANSTSCAGK